MNELITKLINLGVSKSLSVELSDQIQHYLKKNQKHECWKLILKTARENHFNFLLFQFLYKFVYTDWNKIPRPVWYPDADFTKHTNLFKLIKKLKFKDYAKLNKWSVSHYPEFWTTIIETLDVIFDEPYQSIVNLAHGLEAPHWLPGAKLNIVNSCFKANVNNIAIISQDTHGNKRIITYGELNKLSNRVANSLSKRFDLGDRIAICMPMSIESIAIYLGIIKAGYCAVPIPESFMSDEIAKRLRISKVKAIFSQYDMIYNNKHIWLYEKLIDANAPYSILLLVKDKRLLRNQDICWEDFLDDNDNFSPLSCHPDDPISILFSSGVIGEPKAIPWNHTTPIKCASDAYLYHNIQPSDIFCWPTNLGWMMGPWLVFASLINNATIALFEGKPTGEKFGKFISDFKVTILGITPTMIKSWRTSQCMEKFNWTSIKLFSSTGECSNIDDMLYLMSLANYCPIIEYCGGTEIGGAYLTSTLISPIAPAAFTTPTLGLNFVIIDEDGQPSNTGEVALIPPSIGLSTSLVNKDHHKIYYADMPRLVKGQVLRRHGDQIKKFPNDYYRILGRIDDTMNLSGIKISAAEIESVINQLPTIREAAAIAISPKEGGPSKLVIYAVPQSMTKFNTNQLKSDMQSLLRQHLNPLFKIHEVILRQTLPKTVSNKIIRRILREEYREKKIEASFKNKGQVKRKICLALQGGGAYGAYTWGILDKLLEDDRLEIHSISATSAGSINAVILAYGMCQGGNQGARSALSKFWRTLSIQGAYYSPIRQIFSAPGISLDTDITSQLSFIFFDTMSRIFSPYLLNPTNFSLVRSILLEIINFDHLKKYNEIKLFLSATNVKTGMLRVFENSEIDVDVVLASSCLPHLNQAVRIDDEYYWDGGFLGNPAIYPLIYNSVIDDIIIVHNNPIFRDQLPMISADIESRINEISFNSSLIRELRTIAFVTKLIDKKWIKDEYKEKLRRKNIHIIRSDEIMNQFKLINKYNWHWDFISYLHHLGQNTVEVWLKNNFHLLGSKPSIDFSEFLGDDTQTLR